MSRHVPRQSDRDLIESARHGSMEAFAVLYQHYHGAIKAYAFSLVKDKDLAEDVAQEVFAVACKDLKRLQKTEYFGTWLGGICRNTAKQFLRIRSRKIDPTALTPSDRQHLGPSEVDLSISVMQQAILDLPQKYREVIALRYYDSLPYERIAAVLGLTIQGVNGRLIRAKRKIEQHLRRQGFTGGDYENA